MRNRQQSIRNTEETARLVFEWDRSEMKRRDYCEHHGIPLTTFDYYRRRTREQQRQKAVRLVPVSIVSPKAKTEPGAEAGKFTLVLVNGRRIEGGWGVAEEDLARLLRVAERA
jgi:hypothetical protein